MRAMTTRYAAMGHGRPPDHCSSAVRYSGASLGYQLASPLAGGLAPLIATALLQWSGGRPWPIAAYLVVMALITIVSVWLAKETHRSELSEAKTAAAEARES